MSRLYFLRYSDPTTRGAMANHRNSPPNMCLVPRNCLIPQKSTNSKNVVIHKYNTNDLTEGCINFLGTLTSTPTGVRRWAFARHSARARVRVGRAVRAHCHE